ncbi:hypothetical protein NEMBOFW57_007296 [Staphylotrichum longicolle]|uniref:Uncharacterized protein n=1 Tax=Staphylotrichum longicolle TaxID=669026 RepID=A0AAD4EUT1_9PEZI|nr:hypothetical protein NEMBOFW57_007296 [Staphylotrichum longicolle]
MAAYTPPTCVHRATLMYAQNRPLFQHEKPYSVLSYLKDGTVTSNLTWEHGEEEEMHDLRHAREEIGLDSHGFRYCIAPTKFAGWLSRKHVEEEYLPEVKELIIREVADVDEVQIFDWRDWPLALCDGKSIAYDDLLEVDLIRKDYIGYTMYATYRPGYKWYFLDCQKPYEEDYWLCWDV